MGRDGKAEPHVHPAAVPFDRRVEESIDPREVHDFIELGLDLAARHAQDRPVEKDVFAPRQFRMKAGADLEQAPHAPAQLDPAGGRLGDATEDFQQRALARTVAPDHPHDRAGLDAEMDVIQSPDRFVIVGGSTTIPPAQPGGQ